MIGMLNMLGANVGIFLVVLQSRRIDCFEQLLAGGILSVACPARRVCTCCEPDAFCKASAMSASSVPAITAV